MAQISPKVFTSPVTVSLILTKTKHHLTNTKINTRAKDSGFVMNPERFSTEFGLLVTYKIPIRCKRFWDTSQIENVWNPESKVQNLYMKPLVGVDESTLGQFPNGPNKRRTYDLLYHQFGCFANELLEIHVGTTSFPVSLFAVPGESKKRHAGNRLSGGRSVNFVQMTIIITLSGIVAHFAG